MDHDRIIDTIRRQAITVVPELQRTQLTTDRTLADAGCNSIDRAEIVALVMEDLDVTVPLDQFTSSHTLLQLAELLDRHG
jgi:polyketide biosynthesis acyl carrier protein